MESYPDVCRGGGPFESHADRLDLRALLEERAEAVDPLRHPSAWFLGGGDSDLPEPAR